MEFTSFGQGINVNLNNQVNGRTFSTARTFDRDRGVRNVRSSESDYFVVRHRARRTTFAQVVSQFSRFFQFRVDGSYLYVHLVLLRTRQRYLRSTSWRPAIRNVRDATNHVRLRDRLFARYFVIHCSDPHRRIVVTTRMLNNTISSSVDTRVREALRREYMRNIVRGRRRAIFFNSLDRHNSVHFLRRQVHQHFSMSYNHVVLSNKHSVGQIVSVDRKVRTFFLRVLRVTRTTTMGVPKYGGVTINQGGTRDGLSNTRTKTNDGPLGTVFGGDRAFLGSIPDQVNNTYMIVTN